MPSVKLPGTPVPSKQDECYTGNYAITICYFIFSETQRKKFKPTKIERKKNSNIVKFHRPLEMIKLLLLQWKYRWKTRTTRDSKAMTISQKEKRPNPKRRILFFRFQWTKLDYVQEKIDEDRQHTENVSSISSRLEAKLEDINAHIPKKNLRKKIMKIKTERILLILCKR